MESAREYTLKDIPDHLIESTMERLWHFTVGFVQVGSQAPALLGSGVLVITNGIQAIMTAAHVVDILPRSGRLGLILSKNTEQTTIDVEGLYYLKIDRGERLEEGPDISAVILPPTIASAISSKKTFYNLDIRKDLLLKQPPEDRRGFWITNGFVEELTLTDPSPSSYEIVKAFCQFGAVGGVDDYTVKDDHDYYSFPLVCGKNSSIPKNFGGTSGGGLWHVVLDKPNGDLTVSQLLLQGLAFYQQPFVEDRSALRCHGAKSIYGVAYTAIAQHGP